MKAYKIKITIKDSHPPIWRRLIVPAGLSFSQFTVILNEVMGWSGEHVYSYKCEKPKFFIEESFEKNPFDVPYRKHHVMESAVTLIDEVFDMKTRVTYLYDLRSCWLHSIVVEEILEDYDKRYPVILKYKGNNLYEDCGGLKANYEMQEILKDPSNSEYDSVVQRVGSQKDQSYSMQEVNERLQRYTLLEQPGKSFTLKQIYSKLSDEAWKGFHPIDEVVSIHKKMELDIRAFVDSVYKDVERNLEALSASAENITLSEIFQDYAKDELQSIAKLHHLGGYSKYNKKALAQWLSKAILQKDIMREYFMFLDDEELELFRRFAGNARPEEASEEEMDLASVLIEGGYCGASSMNDLFVPREVADAYKKNCDSQWKIQRKKFQELLVYMNACAELYGVCFIEQILELYKKYTGNTIEKVTMYNFYVSVPESKKCWVYDGFHVIHKMFLEEGTIDEICREYEGKSYYIPSRYEIEHMGRKGFFPFDRYMKALQSYLEQKLFMIEEIDLVTMIIQSFMRMNKNVDEILQVLKENMIDMDYANDSRLRELLTEAWNHTRMMRFCGHTPAEVGMEQKLQKVFPAWKDEKNIVNFPVDLNRKIYPNDPCPCGSGKKYKKCCGRK